MNLSADATSYSGNVNGTTTKKSAPEVLSKPQKPDIPTAVQAKTEIGAWGMPITIPTQKQADEIYKKRIEQYHKIKGTCGSTITPDPHQMSLIPKTVSDPPSKSGTHKKINMSPQHTNLLTHRTQSPGPTSLLTNPHLESSPPKLMKTTKQH